VVIEKRIKELELELEQELVSWSLLQYQGPRDCASVG
jgi:hypothetical protein